MPYTAYSLAHRPSLRAHFRRLHRTAWPPFLVDDDVNAIWDTLYTEFSAFQLGLTDGDGRVLAVGNAVPLVWNGAASDLPSSVREVLTRAIADRRRGRTPDTLSALAAIVDPRHRSRGLSARVLRAMAGIAGAHGLRAFVAPVRPSMKGRYPLVPMARYVRWRHPGGGPFDPWLRVHWRLGARVLRIIARGNTVPATVGQWEARTGLHFPESGRYVVPGAFQPIRVDRARDRVVYAEANVWMRHLMPGRKSRRARSA